METALDKALTVCAVTIQMIRYIADPYWPEQEQVISIRKKSGMDRGNAGEEKRHEKLMSYLSTIDISPKAFEELERKAKQPWYRIERGNPESPIILPSHQLTGMLVHAATTAPAGSRLKTDNVRSILKVSDFDTDRVKADGKFSRFVVPKKDGKPISNQRRFMENEYIENFTAKGTIRFAPTLKADSIHKLVTYAFASIGVGACRKMDYGRGVVEAFDVE